MSNKKNTIFNFAGMTLNEAVIRLRAQMIKLALAECHGDRQRAALKLGVNGTDFLSYCIQKGRATPAPRRHAPHRAAASHNHLRLVVAGKGGAQ